MRAVLLAFVLALALAASGCGAADEAADVTPAAAPENASLNIEQVLDTSGPMFIEGYLWALEIVDADGTSVFKDDLEAMEHAEELPAGTYTVKSAMKPCMGNCDQYPGDPVNLCEQEVDLVAPSTAVEISQAADRPCTITVS
jgi:hypothetical protein